MENQQQTVAERSRSQEAADASTPLSAGVETIAVPKHQLQEFTNALIQAKDEKAELMNMLNSATELVGFLKTNILGGEFPKDPGIGFFMKVGTKLMKLKDKLDEETLDTIGAHFNIIKYTAEKYLSEEQVKKITN